MVMLRAVALLLFAGTLFVVDGVSGETWEDSFRQEVALALKPKKTWYGRRKKIRLTNSERVQLFDQCTEFLNSTLGDVVIGTDCYCETKLLPPSISFICKTVNEVCPIPPKVLCGTPGVALSFDFFNLITGGLPVVFQICYDDATLFGSFDVPDFVPLCISPGGSIVTLLFGGILGQRSATKRISSSSPYKTIPDTDTCSARLGNSTCQSCTICDTGGVLLDCANIVPGLVSKTCTPFPTFFSE